MSSEVLSRYQGLLNAAPMFATSKIKSTLNCFSFTIAVLFVTQMFSVNRSDSINVKSFKTAEMIPFQLKLRDIAKKNEFCMRDLLQN